nr:unnamed protein product [Callosobruchus chinensis]
MPCWSCSCKKTY